MNVPFYHWLHETPHGYYRYTEFALRRFMDRCGTQLIQLEASGSRHRRAGQYVLHSHYPPEETCRAAGDG